MVLVNFSLCISFFFLFPFFASASGISRSWWSPRKQTISSKTEGADLQNECGLTYGLAQCLPDLHWTRLQTHLQCLFQSPLCTLCKRFQSLSTSEGEQSHGSQPQVLEEAIPALWGPITSSLLPSTAYCVARRLWGEGDIQCQLLKGSGEGGNSCHQELLFPWQLFGEVCIHKLSRPTLSSPLCRARVVMS